MSAAPTAQASGQTLGSYVARAYSSTIGLKIAMAVSGLLFFVWLILHVAGNLTVFGGAETMNKYAALLKDNPGLLWGQRIGLAAVVLVHVLTALRIAAINKRARPERYQVRTWRAASFASRTMLVSGLIVLAFLVFHLAHFTWGFIYPDSFATVDPQDPAKVVNVYAMVVASFQKPWVVLVYVGTMALVALHLSHGLWGANQSLGANGRRWTPFMMKASKVLGIALALAFAAIPLGVFLGIAK